MTAAMLVSTFFLVWVVLGALLPDDEGSTAVEYAILALGIFFVVFVAVFLLGNAVALPLSTVANHL